MTLQVSEAWAAVALWAKSQGADAISTLPGVWRGATDEWKVTINGHREEVEDVPPYGVLLEHKTFLRVAVLQPNGGSIVGSEDEVIAHFKALTP